MSEMAPIVQKLVAITIAPNEPLADVRDRINGHRDETGVVAERKSAEDG